MKKRVRLTFTGRVQGVGFRPTVFRLATSQGLSGFVMNSPAGVVAEIEGDPVAVSSFADEFRARPPRQARVDRVTAEEIAALGDHGFRIVPSQRSGDLVVGFPPDLATCEDCVRELLDPSDRRHRYPFINCTNCGPRFTIVRELPYDRAKTSMDSFALCPACRAEYENPADRRFDAQPNACAVCGPALQLISKDGPVVEGSDPVHETAELLKRGAILAIKSLGGYHLACDARSDGAVRTLRERKGRPHKPLAVMFASLEELRGCAEVSAREQEELLDPAAPVVVLTRRGDATLSSLISPDTNDLGAFLPYTPLHHLLLSEISPLVMTSGNLSEEPIAKDEIELRRILGRIADYALVHDRPILRRCDDSVIRIAGNERTFLRRSRGWVPGSVDLPLSGPPVLACGAELKNTFCLTRGDQAFLSQHIGDLVEYPSYEFFSEAAADLAKLLQIRPRIVAHDLHPGYESTRFAQKYDADTRIAVQHHHAHIASCMVEHGITEPVIGVAFDGTGYGPDETVWGGEFLVADLRDFRRAGHLKPYRMPGGDEAIRHPARMALSVLIAELGDEAERLAAALLPSVSSDERAVLVRLVSEGLHAPWTSSAGRLFDAVSALAGLCDTISYEGQAAIRLQTAAGEGRGEPYDWEIRRGPGPLVLSFGPAVRQIVAAVQAGTAKSEIAARFHRAVAAGAAEMCDALRSSEGLDKVVLSGGVFQNDLLLGRLRDELNERGFRVYCHRAVPTNDGGIALGQAAVALARVAANR